jgi:selenocysteine lyase/cysteine desulfurase
MLGPMSAGIFFVREALQEMLRPSLLGSWNVRSPNFIAQEEIAFERGGRRYEPGALNISGILGMKAGIELIQEIGLPAISAQLLKLKARLHVGLQPQGFTFLGPEPQSSHASGITTVQHPQRSLEEVAKHLNEQSITPSLRHNRAGKPLLRFSPHFYNTEAEMDRVAEVITTSA